MERQHQTLKTSLKAALIDMGDEYKDRWYDFLPWILLLKRSSFQKELGASPAMMAYGNNLAIPGDLLRDPGEPLSVTELTKLKEFVNKIDHKNPKVNSNPVKHEIPEPPDSVTHVYTKQYNTTGLQAPYMGPFPVVLRPSRTQVKIQVGVNVRGEPRYEIRNWKDLKIGHLRPDAKDASRPKRGRPAVAKADTTASSEAANSTELQTINKPVAADVPVSADLPVEPFQINGGKRKTRNPNPIYVDAIGPPPLPAFSAGNSNWLMQPAYSASQNDLDFINQCINHRPNRQPRQEHG